MEINIYTSDIRDFDKEVDRKLDVAEENGTDLFDENDRLTYDNLQYSVEPFTYLSIMLDMQEQINQLSKTVEQLKKKTGWVSGYDDHGWDTSEDKSE